MNTNDTHVTPLIGSFASASGVNPYNKFGSPNTSSYQYGQRQQAYRQNQNHMNMMSATESSSLMSNQSDKSSVACNKIVSSQLLTGLLIGIFICGVPLGIMTVSYIKEKETSEAASAAAASCTYPNGTLITTLPGQCTAYTNITDNTRLFNSTACCYTPDCSLTPGWYRFVGTGGTQITRTPVSSGYCGQSYASWFNGSYPTAAGTSVSGVVCTTYASTFCATPYSVTISVTNCNNYYVFYLVQMPYCSIRYCTT